MDSRPPRPEDAFTKFTDGSPVALAICSVSVIFILLSTSAVTRAAFIIIRNIVSPRAGQIISSRLFPIRERMLLGLFISHIWTGILLLVSHFMSLSSSLHIFLGSFCGIQTIAVSTGVLTTHLWTIVLAAVTYLSVAHPLGSIIARVEGAWFGIGLWIYALAIALSTGLWKLSGAMYVGGYCDFGGNIWKYNELMNLIPRLCVLITIFSIYIQLYVLLRCGRRGLKDALGAKTEERSQDLNTLHGSIVGRNELKLWESGPTVYGNQTTAASPGWINESMADLVNRKVRALMLLFLLSYTILVIVSLSKLVYDTASSKPSVALHSTARWTLFLQGALDALAYGWASARLKQSVRKLEEQRHGLR